MHRVVLRCRVESGGAAPYRSVSQNAAMRRIAPRTLAYLATVRRRRALHRTAPQRIRCERTSDTWNHTAGPATDTFVQKWNEQYLPLLPSRTASPHVLIGTGAFTHTHTHTHTLRWEPGIGWDGLCVTMLYFFRAFAHILLKQTDSVSSLNNATILHHLTSYSTPCCPTT